MTPAETYRSNAVAYREAAVDGAAGGEQWVRTAMMVAMIVAIKPTQVSGLSDFIPPSYVQPSVSQVRKV